MFNIHLFKYVVSGSDFPIPAAMAFHLVANTATQQMIQSPRSCSSAPVETAFSNLKIMIIINISLITFHKHHEHKLKMVCQSQRITYLDYPMKQIPLELKGKIEVNFLYSRITENQ